MKLKRMIVIIAVLIATIACQIEGDPCKRLCDGRTGDDYAACYAACEEGR